MIEKQRLTIAGVGLSVLLFGLKTYAGVLTGSLAIVSDSLNSLLDVFSYTTVMVAVRVQRTEPDQSHQFGHSRAEPLAGLIIAVLASVLGFTVVRDALTSIARGDHVSHAPVALYVLILSMAAKTAMWWLYRESSRSSGSIALKAASIDSRNDVLTSAVALVGYAAGDRWDSVAGLAVGAWILVSGVQVGLENSGYLLGKSPPKEFLEQVRSSALAVPEVRGVNDVRAHFIGDIVQVEVHIELPADMDVKTAHDIGMAVQSSVLTLPDVENVFVHIDVEGDPVRLPFTLG